MPTPESQAPPAIPARQGLSAAEAARRLATEGPNLLPGSAPKSTLAIVRDVAEIYRGSVELLESEDLGGLLVRGGKK